MSGQASNMNASSCRALTAHALADSKARGIYVARPEQPCSRGYFKIMSFIDKGKDYHWYRQHDHVMYTVAPGETLQSIATEFQVPVSSIVSPTPHPRPGELVFIRNANVWSHKQGFATGPLLRDASGKLIFDPRAANRNYGMYNYRTFCGAMCIKNTHPTSDITEDEARRLQTLLQKRVSLLNAGDKQGGQLVARGPEI
jgi:hypothetical protein